VTLCGTEIDGLEETVGATDDGVTVTVLKMTVGMQVLMVMVLKETGELVETPALVITETGVEVVGGTTDEVFWKTGAEVVVKKLVVLVTVLRAGQLVTVLEFILALYSYGNSCHRINIRGTAGDGDLLGNIEGTLSGIDGRGHEGSGDD
jgi:hypothetical protein